MLTDWKKIQRILFMPCDHEFTESEPFLRSTRKKEIMRTSAKVSVGSMPEHIDDGVCSYCLEAFGNFLPVDIPVIRLL